MTAPTVTRHEQRCDRCHHILTPEPADLGFGYCRTPDTDLPDTTPVPDGIELIALTGRAPRGTR
ncbi:hypothetical protein AB0M36_34715 [Actinoplanes sp. NPDC051346]|uniref:hypothetical protein n=1 Tax=Actinoplanes sp. NPDC051346 TaxID=3155048 RepID=UPI00341A1D43